MRINQAINRFIPGFVHPWVRHLGREEISRILLAGAASAFIVKVAGAALNFGAQVLLARMLGTREYGLFAYAMSWMLVLSIPAQLGLRESLIRFIPEYEVNHRPAHIRGILGFAVRISFLASVIIAGLFALILFWSPAFWTVEQINVLWIMLCVLPAFTLIRIWESGLRAFRRVGLAFTPEHIVRPIMLCSLCAIGFFYFEGLLAWQAWAFNTAAFIMAFILGLWWLFRSLPAEVRSATARKQTRQWMAISFPMLLMAGMNVFLNQSGVVFLGFFVSPAEVGIYAVSAKIVILITFALTSVNAIAGPMISRLFHGGRKDELQRMLTLAARGIFAITLLAAIFLGLFGKHVLNIFGPDFVRGYGPLLILMIGQIVNSLAGSVGLLLNMTGHQNNAAKILGVSVVINISVNLALIPGHGVYGAAVATALSLAAWNILMLRYVWKSLKFNPTIISIDGKGTN